MLLSGCRAPSRRNAEGVVFLTDGGREHNAEGGPEEEAVWKSEVFVAVNWLDNGDEPTLTI
jgi:hypothetical protein